MLFPELGSRFGVDPFAEMRRVQNEMNRIFSGLATTAESGYPLVNLWLGEDSVVVTTELPGLGPEDVDLTVRQDTLTIQGKVEPTVGGDEVVWHRRERGQGGFARTVQLPFRVDPDAVQGRFENGVLEVELKRPEADRPRKIQIKAQAA